jgi:hypothetical protein
LRAGAYRLGPARRIHHGDETIEDWSAPDALVLKATAIVLAGLVLPRAHADLDLLTPVRPWCRTPIEVRALRPGSDAAGTSGEIGSGSQVVREAEDVQQRAEPPIRGAGLVELGGELLDALPIGFAVGVGGRRPRLGRRLQLGDPTAPDLQLGLESLGSLVRRSDPGLESGQAGLELGPGRRCRLGALPRGGRLGEADLQVMPQGLQPGAVFSQFLLAVASQPIELGARGVGLPGQLLVAPGKGFELVTALLDRPGEPPRIGLMAGRLAAGGVGLPEEGGQAIPLRSQGLGLPERGVPLPDEFLDLIAEPSRLLAEGRDLPLELQAGGIQPLLPGPPLALGLVPLAGGPPLELGDAGLELLLAGRDRPDLGVEAIPLGADLH